MLVHHSRLIHLLLVLRLLRLLLQAMLIAIEADDIHRLARLDLK